MQCRLDRIMKNLRKVFILTLIINFCDAKETLPIATLSRAAEGIDITKLCRYDHYSGERTGFMKPVFEFKFNQKKSFKAFNISYTIPDFSTAKFIADPDTCIKISSVVSNNKQEWRDASIYSVSLPVGKLTYSRLQERTLNQVFQRDEISNQQKNFSVAVENPSKFINTTDSVEENVTLGMFAESENYKLAKRVMKDPKRAMIRTQGMINSFKLTFDLNSITLDAKLLLAIQTLPTEKGNFTEAEFSKPYENFISQWGTHYSESVIFGGLLKLDIITLNNLHKNFSGNALNTEATKAFRKVATKFGFQATAPQLDPTFKENTDIMFEFYGGIAPQGKYLYDGIVYPQEWKNWSKSVINSPSPLNYQLASITNLIKNNPEKQLLMDKTIKAYLYKAYLRDLKESLQNNLGVWDIFTTFDQRRLKLIQEELKQPLFNTSQNYDLYESPLSFRKDVQLCGFIKSTYKYLENSTDLQTAAEFTNRTCVAINEWYTFKIPITPLKDEAKMPIETNTYLHVFLDSKSGKYAKFAENGCFLSSDLALATCPSKREFDMSHLISKQFSVSGLSLIFPGKWSFLFNNSNSAYSNIISKLALCINVQDKDVNLAGVENSKTTFLQCNPLNESITEEAVLVNDKTKLFSISLRDSIHPVKNVNGGYI